MDNLEDLGMRSADRASSNGLDREEEEQTNGSEKPAIPVKNTAPRDATDLRKTGYKTTLPR